MSLAGNVPVFCQVNTFLTLKVLAFQSDYRLHVLVSALHSTTFLRTRENVNSSWDGYLVPA